MSLFGDGMLEQVNPPLPNIPEFPLRLLLSHEKNVTGLYITGHPLSEYSDALARMTTSTAQLAELMEGEDHGLSFDGQTVHMGGILTEVRQKATKAGNLMGFATLEDLTGTIEALVFPKVLERVSTELMPDSAVILSGRLSIREDEEPKLLLDTVEPLMTNAEYAEAKKNGPLSPLPAPIPNSKKASLPRKPESAGGPSDDPVLPGKTLYLRLPSDSAIGMVKPILASSRGDLPVVLYIESTGAKLRAPQELFVKPTQRLIDRLCDMLGAKNVVLK